MAKALFRSFRRASSLLKPPSLLNSLILRPIFGARKPSSSLRGYPISLNQQNPSCGFRELSHGTVNLVMSDGKLKFEAHEVDPPKKYKWMTKKRLKMQRKREKEKRRAANRKDPRKLTVKRKRKQKFANAAERIKSKLERAKIKEALLIERLKKYEVPKVQGPEVQPHTLTGEERFFLKKMAQKKLNYVPVGRRGIFGGVILNMHMHWKKHETVKVICKPCKPGQVHEYAQEIARLSGGIPIQIIGDHTIIFYRGKNYVQPEVMSPIDTLSKKRALEKSKYEQSLESVRHFIAIAEKELELYYRHIALYGDPNNRNPISILDSPTKDSVESRKPKSESNSSPYNDIPPAEMEMKADSTYQELSEESEHDFVDENLSGSESDSEDDILFDQDGEESEESSSSAAAISSSTMFDSLTFDSKFDTQFRDSRRELNKSLV